MTLSKLPAQILMIRHGEKPEDEKDVHLSPKGRMRAQGLSILLTENQEFLEPGPITTIYAAKPTAAHPSRRSVETCWPLSLKLQLPVMTPCDRNDYKVLVNDILHDGALAGHNVLICWEHVILTKIAHELGVNNPPDWPKDCFDQVWCVTFDHGGKVDRFSVMNQKLLFGDRGD